VDGGDSAKSDMRFPKETRIRSEPYLRLVASLPCALCGIQGSSQAAHPNANKAKALKASDVLVFPLCHEGANGCHAAFDSYQVGGRVIQSFREVEFAAQTQATLIERARADHKVRAVLERVGLITKETA
jgi:hypothetical protein